MSASRRASYGWAHKSKLRVNPGDYRWWYPPPFRNGAAKIVYINKQVIFRLDRWWEVTRVSDGIRFSAYEPFLGVFPPINEMEALALLFDDADE